jgi:RNA polymerase sigma-70 factor (sigma-E family)
VRGEGDGVHQGFDEFVAGRYAALLRSASLLSGNHHDGEDLVQTALVRAVGVWARIADEPEPYVRRIMVNENISRWRRHRGRTSVVADPTAGGEGAAPADPAEDRLDLAAALATLAPRQRTVVVLRYFEDLTERETARLMGTSVGTVKSQTRDALARLRRLVPGLVVDDEDPAERVRVR